MRKTRAERFWNKVNKTDTCWLWLGCIRKDGYGSAWDGEKVVLAHRLSVYLRDGKYPELSLDHLCRVRNCVNPDHLEQVTYRENILRGQGIAAQQARKTHCKRGHPLSGTNLLGTTKDRNRRCLICHNLMCLAGYHRRCAISMSSPTCHPA